MAEFKRATALQKDRLQVLIEAVREYLEVVEKPTGGRHRRTTLVFCGDRYKPVSIQTRFVVPKSQQYNE